MRCQLSLVGALKAALDATRVFRLVGTINGKAGQPVMALTPVGTVWDFEALAYEILPMTRGELSDLRVQRALRRPETGLTDPKPPQKGFTTATLWEARLSDLQRLRDLRWWGALPPGHRDLWLFLAINAMAWLTDSPQVLYREAWALAQEVSPWPEGEVQSRMQAIFKRAKMAHAGQKISWQGREIDPRYHFKNQTIMEWLEITAEEERAMQTLISADEHRRRHREAERERTYRTGKVAQTRSEYLQTSQDRRKQARALQARGYTQKAIAQALNISQQAVSYLLKSV